MTKQEYKVTAFTIDHDELYKTVCSMAGIETGKMTITTSDDGRYVCRLTKSEPIVEQQ